MAEQQRQKIVKVVVLGDIGRSPRMQYHALSLANNGLKVDLIGYMETAPLTDLIENENITITELNPLLFNAGPRIVQYFIKALWQSISLFLTLYVTGSCDYLLCQNPPAIPTLPVCRLYCLLTRAKFVIDWHNYAHSIMALSLSPKHYLVEMSKKIEMYFGQSSNSNICVTYAMKDDLMQNWNIVSKVLYDRPPSIFHPISTEKKHSWFRKLGQQYPEFRCTGRDDLNLPLKEQNSPEKTAFTIATGKVVATRPERPGLLFSSTSWTPDEDFSVLLEALQVYESTYTLTKNLPKLICVITGKGPMKEHYIKQIATRKWQHVRVVTPWLEAADYPTMVASADLGVCLHTSSSGLDLPMKVVDMFGAGLPVCAFQFKCIQELVKNGINGYTFNSSDELAKQIIQWFMDFPNNQKQNKIADGMRNELVQFQQLRWEHNWNLRAKKIFQE